MASPIRISFLVLTFCATALAGQKKALLIGLDGLRPDALLVANTPNLDALIAAGAVSYAAQVGPNTVSGPGWSAMLTGVWSDRHGVTNNSFSGADYGTYPEFFTRLESELADVDTASLTTWSPLHDILVTGADFEFFQDYTAGGDAAVAVEGAQLLATQDFDAMFVYFADIDVAGHNHGFSPTVPQYLAEIEQVDGQLGQLLSAIENRPTYASEDWLILVSTDHGGIGTGHGGGLPLQRTTFYIASGPSVVQGALITVPNVVDVAATLLVHLGVELDPAWRLDGRPLGFPMPAELGANLVFNGDAEYAAGNVGWSADRGVAGWYDVGNLTALLWDSGGGFPASTDPGPPARGTSYLSGGPGAGDDVMTLTIDVSAVASWIDQGGVEYELSGYLGGYAEQEDRMTFSARWFDFAGAALGSAAIGPVTLADRQAEIGGSGEALTGLLPRATSGALPAGTRTVQFEVLAEHFAGGGTDGYGDDFSFVLHLADSLDCDGNDIVDAQDIAAGTHPDQDGNGIPDACESIGLPTCTSAPNSASTGGTGALLYATGSTSMLANDLTLFAQALPPGVSGIFYFGASETLVPFGDGLRCVAGSTFRLTPTVFASLTGVASRALDLTTAPAAGHLTPGSTWYFQHWFRDVLGGPAGFNLSSGLALSFE